ncbi:putative pyrimidine 5'-nucleotidase [Hamiltosporidium magnivora]|uniref:Putative pyrimidine 5'-nucleotidase n=1 Tax=Hamiltosporidium magnivora TaxID=148818 RepID=A0A4V2JW48_9MICR|nr:putative pyrimidine 5'-nucleotidase [Hamiltosporidium magnivora]
MSIFHGFYFLKHGSSIRYFSEFKDIINPYFKNLDDKDDFRIYFDSYVSEHYSDDFKREIEICESGSEDSKEIIANDLKNIVKPVNTDLVTKCEFKSEEQSNPNKKIEELYIYDFLFGNTETEYNSNNETQDTVETNLRRKNFEANGVDNKILKCIYNMDIGWEIGNQAYGFHSMISELFQIVFQKYYESSFDKAFHEEHFVTNLSEMMDQSLEHMDEKAKEIVFTDFLRNLCKTEPFDKFENIFNYLEKISSNFVYLGAFPDETTYVSLSNTRIASIDYKEKVLVFDMDNTLFPTKFIKKELEKNGLSQTQDDIGKLSEYFLYQKFRGKYRLPESRCKDIVQRTFKKNYKTEFQTVNSHYLFKDEFKFFLQKIPYKKICFTDAPKYWAKIVLIYMNLFGCFDIVIPQMVKKCEEEFVSKKNDKAYEFVEKFLGTLPSNIYFYDDKPGFIKRANERGWNAFKVNESLKSVLEESLPLPSEKKKEETYLL